MSLSRTSNQYYNAPTVIYRRNRYSDTVTDEQYKQLHWTEQVKVKRRYDTPKPYRETGDFDNRTDNWESPENYEEK